MSWRNHLIIHEINENIAVSALARILFIPDTMYLCNWVLSFRCRLSSVLLRRRPHFHVVISVNEKVNATKMMAIYLRCLTITRSFSLQITTAHSVVFVYLETGIRARYSGRGLIDLSAELIVRPTTICRAERALCLIVSLSKCRCIVMRFALAMTALAMTSYLP